jgi:integrase
MKQEPHKRKLTEVLIRKAPPKPDGAYFIWDSYTRGLALRVHPTDRKSWYAIYRSRGRPRWLHLGDASTIGLGDARMMTNEVMLAVARGQDPAAEKRAKRNAGTFGELASKYVEQHAKKFNKSWKQGATLVERYGSERWRNLPAASITRNDVKNVLAPLKPVLSNQVLASISAVFSWGVKEELVSANVCIGIERNETQSRERILSESELPLFWKALDDAVEPVIAAALKVILLSGQRPGEVSNMRFEHLKDGFWELPGAPSAHWPGTKNGSSHRVALSAPVLALIEEQVDGETPASGYVFESRPGHPLQRLDRSMKLVVAKLSIDPVTPHDLRRTSASMIASLGFGRQAIDRILNHADHSIASVYDRHSYAKEDQQIMQAVAAKIIDLVEGRADSKVLFPKFLGK